MKDCGVRPRGTKNKPRELAIQPNITNERLSGVVIPDKNTLLDLSHGKTPKRNPSITKKRENRRQRQPREDKAGAHCRQQPSVSRVGGTPRAARQASFITSATLSADPRSHSRNRCAPICFAFARPSLVVTKENSLLLQATSAGECSGSVVPTRTIGTSGRKWRSSGAQTELTLLTVHRNTQNTVKGEGRAEGLREKQRQTCLAQND